MLNALKNPFPEDDDPDDREEVGKKNFFKTKRPLLILLFLGLVVSAFSLLSDPKKTMVAKKNPLLKPQIATPLANRKPIDPSPPAVKLSGPIPITQPLVKNKIAELTYKGDKEYLALTRYGGFSQATQKPVRASGQKVRDTVTPGDKPLILGGRRFDFKGVQPKTRARRYADFNNRLKKPVPKMEIVPEDYLDLRLNETKSSKELIFHSSSPAFGKYNRQKTYLKDEQPEKKKPQVLEDIPETKLLLMETDTSLLILRNGRESLDLLAGNEKINRKAFNRW